MGYYQGDHYRSRRFAGDYYRGDPGFFSFIGKALKGAVTHIPGLGPVLEGAAAIRGLFKRHGVPLPAPYVPGPAGLIPRGGMAIQRAVRSLHPRGRVLAPRGGGGGITTPPAGTPRPPPAHPLGAARLRPHPPHNNTHSPPR